MTTVFIGSGEIGSTMARASAATSGEAAAAGDIVVVSVPVKAFPDLSAAPLAGNTVIDTCNCGPERDGHIPELDGKSLTSSELLLRHLPDAVLVKAFNNIYFKHLLSPARPPARRRRRRRAHTCRSPGTPRRRRRR
jgi:predicted dinucleotide-binding enzyme